MKSFNVIIHDFNGKTFVPYDIMSYLIKEYNELETKPSTNKELRDFVEQKALYQWWSRCEYEIILVDWPNKSIAEKWDVYRQVMMNIDVIMDILIENINGNSTEKINN